MRNLACICTTFVLISCGPKISETGRLENPAKTVAAISAIRETDATVATPTEIYIVPASSSLQGRKPIFRADKVAGLKIRWLDDTSLDITAQSARTFIEETEAMVPGSAAPIHVRYEIAVRPE